ncbi:MAG: NAD(P)H-binding protein [Acidobacteria bacterium]|nr:NAD(P)H-binding protein [Acidobacteriota bacterium]
MVSRTLAVTGANSAVGCELLAQVALDETLAAVAAVRRPEAVDVLPRSPRITPHVIHYGDPGGLQAAFEGADCVVHLAGILFEGPTSDYRRGNVESTRAVVAAAQATGAEHIVFISSVGADPASPNGYFWSKGEAERLVAESGIGATNVRTPLLLGPGTAGGRALLRDASSTSVRLLGGGTHRLRPLDVDDLCRAILNCCRRPGDGARTCELVGPTAVAYRDLVQQTARRLGREVSIGSTPVWLARLVSRFAGLVRRGGLTPDVIDVITSDETVDRNADGELGVTLTPLAGSIDRLCEAAGSREGSP